MKKIVFTVFILLTINSYSQESIDRLFSDGINLTRFKLNNRYIAFNSSYDTVVDIIQSESFLSEFGIDNVKINKIKSSSKIQIILPSYSIIDEVMYNNVLTFSFASDRLKTVYYTGYENIILGRLYLPKVKGSIATNNKGYITYSYMHTIQSSRVGYLHLIFKNTDTVFEKIALGYGTSAFLAELP